MKVLTDKEVGELWRRCLPGSGVSTPFEERVILLIHKLVEERAWHYDQAVVFHREGKPTKNSMKHARRDFGIDQKEREGAHGSD